MDRNPQGRAEYGRTCSDAPHRTQRSGKSDVTKAFPVSRRHTHSSNMFAISTYDTPRDARTGLQTEPCNSKRKFLTQDTHRLSESLWDFNAVKCIFQISVFRAGTDARDRRQHVAQSGSLVRYKGQDWCAVSTPDRRTGISRGAPFGCLSTSIRIHGLLAAWSSSCSAR